MVSSVTTTAVIFKVPSPCNTDERCRIVTKGKKIEVGEKKEAEKNLCITISGLTWLHGQI